MFKIKRINPKNKKIKGFSEEQKICQEEENDNIKKEFLNPRETKIINPLALTRCSKSAYKYAGQGKNLNCNRELGKYKKTQFCSINGSTVEVH